MFAFLIDQTTLGLSKPQQITRHWEIRWNEKKKETSFYIKNENATQELERLTRKKCSHHTRSIKARPTTRDAANPYNLWRNEARRPNQHQEQRKHSRLINKKWSKEWRTCRGESEQEPSSNSPNGSSSWSWPPPRRDCGSHLNLSILRWLPLREERSRELSFHPPPNDRIERGGTFSFFL